MPPPLLVLTDRSMCVAGDLLAALTLAVDHGARAVVLREKDLPGPCRAQLVRDVHTVLAGTGGLLVVAGTDGEYVHLAAGDPFPTPRPRLVGRSCHGADECSAARAEDCDYMTVSPVFATPSKPGYGPPLGVDGLAALTALGPPAYALGGVRPDDIPGCLAAGARGVAVMGAVMRQPRIVADYLAALREVSV